MATAAISGKDGSVSSDGSVAEVKGWSAVLTARTLDATSFDSAGWEEYVVGLKGGTFEFNSLTDQIAVGDVAALQLNTSATTISGAAKIEEGPVECEVDGIVMFRYRGKFSGVITIT